MRSRAPSVRRARATGLYDCSMIAAVVTSGPQQYWQRDSERAVAASSAPEDFHHSGVGSAADWAALLAPGVILRRLEVELGAFEAQREVAARDESMAARLLATDHAEFAIGGRGKRSAAKRWRQRRWCQR